MKPQIIWMISFFLMILAPGPRAAEIHIIDAHSQFDQNIQPVEIIQLMDQAGVSRTILTARSRVEPEQVVAFASRYPDRITPAVKTKGEMDRPKEKFRKSFQKQMGMPQFGAMGEVLLWHEEKTTATITRRDGTRGSPPKVVFSPDHPRVKGVIEATIKRKWPFIAHIEFANIHDARERREFMSKFEDMLRRYPHHPFLLNNLGYLNAKQARRLIEARPNIHFIPSWSNPIVAKGKHKQPFVNMFKGEFLAPQWKDLMVEYPDRFVFGLDIIMAHQWRKIYVRQVVLWRKALAELPPEVAHAVAHRNAERLWKLPPAK